MKRRKFMVKTLCAATASVFHASFSANGFQKVTEHQLKKRSKIGLIATVFRINKNRLKIAVNNMDELGYQPNYTHRNLMQKRYLAGSDANSIEDIHHMYSRNEGNYQSLQEVFVDRLSPLNVPIVNGFSFGHVKNKYSPPMGALAYFDSET